MDQGQDRDAAGSRWPQWRGDGVVLVLSGPSGCGKSTLITAFLARRPDFAASVSTTTRPPRPGEIDGRDYHFTDEAIFCQRIADGAFLEHAVVFGRHRYGTLRAPVEERRAAGLGVIMDVDVQGAAQIRDRLPVAVQVFIMPPSAAELERRLRGRGTDEPEVVARRLAEATDEIACWSDYDFVVVNDDLGPAVARLEAIADAAAWRTGSFG